MTVRRTIAPAVLAGAAALALGACGSSDKKSDSASSKPQTIAISASGTSKAPKYTAPATAKAGAATLTFTNHATGDTSSAQLAYVTGKHSDAEISAELGKAMQSKPVAKWFQGGGGPTDVPSGKASSETQLLKDGTYYVLGSADTPPKGPLTKITVSGDSGAKLPKTDGEVDATEYTFIDKGIQAGKPFLAANRGGQWHHFLVSKLAPGANAAQVKKFLLSNGKGGGKPPIEGGQRPALETTVMDPGVSQVVNAPKAPGKYVFYCFVSDKQGGPPHVMKGMVKEITVK